jgi:hypothetical protein
MGALFDAAFLFAGGEAFLNSFLAEMLGESHGAGAVGFRTDGFQFMEEGVILRSQSAC